LTRSGSAGLVDLVDRDDDRNLGGLGVIDRLDRLFLDAIVGGDHQHDDVGDIGAAQAHLGERGVAGRVDEGDLGAAVKLNLIGADMLGDAAGLVGGDIGLAQGIEQRGLAVVDVPHDGDHWRPRGHFGIHVWSAFQPEFDICRRNALDPVAKFLHQELRGVGVDRLIDRRHDPHFHQRLDHLAAAFGHAVGQFLDGDRLGHDDLADHPLRRLVCLLFL
jgi:hypothetical protein